MLSRTSSVASDDVSVEISETGLDFWAVAFPVLFLLSAAVAIIVCADAVPLTLDVRHLIVRAFIVLLFCVFGAYAGGEEGFGARLAWNALAAGVATAMFVAPRSNPAPGYAATVFYAVVVVSTLTTFDRGQEGSYPVRHSLRQGLTHAWAVVGVLLFARALRPFDHPEPRIPPSMVPDAVQAFFFRHTLDLRLLISLVAGTVLLGASVSRMGELGRPVIPDVPRARLDGVRLSRRTAKLLRPFLNAVVVAWAILRVPLNITWKALATLAVLFARLVRAFAQLVLEELLMPARLATIVGQMALWLALLAAAGASGRVSITLEGYLREAPRIASFGVLGELGLAFVLGALAAVLVTALAAIFWTNALEPDEISTRAVLCALMYLLVFAVAGIALYVLAQGFSELGVRGFAALGPVASAVLTLFGVVVVCFFGWSAWKRKRA